jgi:hypothetical protein
MQRELSESRLKEADLVIAPQRNGTSFYDFHEARGRRPAQDGPTGGAGRSDGPTQPRKWRAETNWAAVLIAWPHLLLRVGAGELAAFD